MEGESEISDVIFAIPVLLIFALLAFHSWKSAPKDVRKDLTALLDAGQSSLSVDEGLALEADLVWFSRGSTLVGTVLFGVAAIYMMLAPTGQFMVGMILVAAAFIIGRALARAAQSALLRRRSTGTLRSARLIDRDITRYLPRRALWLQRSLVAALMVATIILLLAGLTSGFSSDVVGALVPTTIGLVTLLAIAWEQRQVTRSPSPPHDSPAFVLHDLRIGIGVWDAHSSMGFVTAVVLFAALSSLIDGWQDWYVLVGLPLVGLLYWGSGSREAAVWHFRRSEQVNA